MIMKKQLIDQNWVLQSEDDSGKKVTINVFFSCKEGAPALKIVRFDDVDYDSISFTLEEAKELKQVLSDTKYIFDRRNTHNFPF